ncbi:hypothetical protein Aduo_015381 [Ancylostoma duodenale]
MGMNLRGFLSNYSRFHETIPSEACAKSAIQNVLGVEWNAKDDSLHIHCRMPHSEKVTKRIVAPSPPCMTLTDGWYLS